MEGKLCLQETLGLSCVTEMKEAFEEEDERTKKVIMIIGYKDPSRRGGEGREGIVNTGNSFWMRIGRI